MSEIAFIIGQLLANPLAIPNNPLPKLNYETCTISQLSIINPQIIYKITNQQITTKYIYDLTKSMQIRIYPYDV